MGCSRKSLFPATSQRSHRRGVQRLTDFLAGSPALHLDLVGIVHHRIAQNISDDLQPQRHIHFPARERNSSSLRANIGVNIAPYVLDGFRRFAARYASGAFEGHMLQENGQCRFARRVSWRPPAPTPGLDRARRRPAICSVHDAGKPLERRLCVCRSLGQSVLLNLGLERIKGHLATRSDRSGGHRGLPCAVARGDGCRLAASDRVRGIFADAAVASVIIGVFGGRAIRFCHFYADAEWGQSSSGAVMRNMRDGAIVSSSTRGPECNARDKPTCAAPPGDIFKPALPQLGHQAVPTALPSPVIGVKKRRARNLSFDL